MFAVGWCLLDIGGTIKLTRTLLLHQNHAQLPRVNMLIKVRTDASYIRDESVSDSFAVAFGVSFASHLLRSRPSPERR